METTATLMDVPPSPAFVSSEAPPEASKTTAVAQLPAACIPKDSMPHPAFQSDVIHDVVITASPSHPPYSLLMLKKLLSGCLRVRTAIHVHSSVRNVLDSVKNFFGENDAAERQHCHLGLTLIWKEATCAPAMIVSPLMQVGVSGEGNIARYLCRLMPALNLYETEDVVRNTEIDYLLDLAQGALVPGDTRKQLAVLRTIESMLGKSRWLLQDTFSLADIVMWSAVQKVGYDTNKFPCVQRWMSQCQSEVFQEDEGFHKAPREQMEKETETAQMKKTCVSSDMDHLLRLLDELGISTQTVTHPEVFTVEAMIPHVQDLPGAVSKNLFLKDKKKNLYLLSVKHDKTVKLNDVAKKIGAKDLRFADESLLLEKLGVRQGCVTAYALLNDSKHEVTFLCDTELMNDSHSMVSFHPLSNAATTAVTPEDFKKFLKHTGHEAQLIDLNV